MANKFKKISATAAICALSFAAMGQAMAADGLITVSGNVKASPCFMDNIDGSAVGINAPATMTQIGSAVQMGIANVTVPDVQSSIAAGSFGGLTAVNLHFAGGVTCANSTYKVSITPSMGYYGADTSIALNGATGVMAATGVGIQAIVGATGTTAIDFSSSSNGQTLVNSVALATTSVASYQFRLARPTNTVTTVKSGLVQTAFTVTIQ